MAITDSIKLMGTVVSIDVDHMAEDSDEGRVRRAFWRNGNEIIIDVHFSGMDTSYQMMLNKTELARYEGVCTASGGSRSERITATLYRSEDGEVLLMGRWHEAGRHFDWWAKLKAVEHFPDEGE